MTKAFVCYHHEKDQPFRDELARLASSGAFVDRSVVAGEFNKNMPDDAVHMEIVEKNLLESQVTILLCGEETRGRKHIDWELQASMIGNARKRKSGILVINLPTIPYRTPHLAFHRKTKMTNRHEEFGHCNSPWARLLPNNMTEYGCEYPEMPLRIIDNIIRPGVTISIVPWDFVVHDVRFLKYLIDEAAEMGPANDYDVSRPRRIRNRAPIPR